MKEKCDYLVVLHHGGKEYYRYPSPNLQKICRKITQKGADLVVCQHSHCIGCFEEYQGSTIVYGQGNFIFDHSESEYWQTSLVLNVNIKNELKVDFIPIIKKNNVIQLAGVEEQMEILSLFHERSEEIMQPGFIEKEYNKFAKESTGHYLRTLSGMGKWISRLDRLVFKGNLLKNKYDRKQLLSIQNYIECEAHRELILTALKGEIYSERNS